jgi:xanthine dehydrogenase accessory factor
MHDLLTVLENKEIYSPGVAATVVSISGSAVRGLGATMAIGKDGTMTGSVSGGCIEGAVIKSARTILAGGKASLLRFCPLEDELFGAMSPCGGELAVMVYPLPLSVIQKIADLHRAGKGAWWGLSTGESGKTAAGISFAGEDIRSSEGMVFSESMSEAERAALETVLGGLPDHDTDWFFCHAPPPVHLVIIGGGHLSVALVRIGKAMDWRVSVIDPRQAFLGADRFPGADTVSDLWPEKAFREIGLNPFCAVAALSHDMKIDDQAVSLALEADCFYVGVLGSRKTLSDRKERLRGDGKSEEQLSMLKGPIGLAIGAKTPEEIALSTAAEIVKALREWRKQ